MIAVNVVRLPDRLVEVSPDMDCDYLDGRLLHQFSDVFLQAVNTQFPGYGFFPFGFYAISSTEPYIAMFDEIEADHNATLMAAPYYPSSLFSTSPERLAHDDFDWSPVNVLDYSLLGLVVRQRPEPYVLLMSDRTSGLMVPMLQKVDEQTYLYKPACMTLETSTLLDGKEFRFNLSDAKL